MKGVIFAFLGGTFITIQGVANANISQDIGTWQTAALTQLTGFLAAFILLQFFREGKGQGFRKVKPLYLSGGTFGALVIFGNVTAMHHIGVTLTIAVILIAQLVLTFIIDSNGWFGLVKQKVKIQQLIGMGLMVAGVVILQF